jgi:hypothetical protein
MFSFSISYNCTNNISCEYPTEISLSPNFFDISFSGFLENNKMGIAVFNKNTVRTVSDYHE